MGSFNQNTIEELRPGNFTVDHQGSYNTLVPISNNQTITVIEELEIR